MGTKKNQSNGSAEKRVEAIRRAALRRYATEERIRILLPVRGAGTSTARLRRSGPPSRGT